MHKTEDLGTVSLSVPGRHNVSNSLAAIALCLNLGLPLDVIKKGLLQFGGTKRRLNTKEQRTVSPLSMIMHIIRPK